jgi:hypothetical protein
LPFAQAPAREPSRVGSILLLLAAGLSVAAMAVDRQVTVVGVARVLLMLQSAHFARTVRTSETRLYDAGIIGSFGLLPWTQVRAYQLATYDRSATITFMLRQPWWSRSTVDITIPRSDLEQASAWLSARIPCVGSVVHPGLPQVAAR